VALPRRVPMSVESRRVGRTAGAPAQRAR
jgi:hypothetical protein